MSIQCQARASIASLAILLPSLYCLSACGSDEIRHGSQPGQSTTGKCTSGSICLTLHYAEAEPPATARVIVLAAAPSSALPPNAVERVVFDTALGGRQAIEIPLRALQPPSDQQLSCRCESLATCACAEQPRVAYGTVLLVNDPNADGKFTTDEWIDRTSEVLIGFGYLLLAYSTQATSQPVAIEVNGYRLFETLPAGWSALDIYGTQLPENSRADRMSFEIVACVFSALCEPPLSN
ncbi:MAG: hypothetical protein H6707_06955 [Deltaproteobacteria bacterium]|nr:hypothetical protein [Deltaproteobacteria bacterium]